MMLSPHFSLDEFTVSETAAKLHINNIPNGIDLMNLRHLATLMEAVRKLLGDVSLKISSGYRCPKLNVAVGGVSNSDHAMGIACDFSHPVLTPMEVCQKINQSDLVYDQVIEEFGRWTHISAHPRKRKQFLIAQMIAGKKTYSFG